MKLYAIDEIATFNWNEIALAASYWHWYKRKLSPDFIESFVEFVDLTATISREWAKTINLNRRKFTALYFEQIDFPNPKFYVDKKESPNAATMSITYRRQTSW